MAWRATFLRQIVTKSLRPRPTRPREQEKPFLRMAGQVGERENDRQEEQPARPACPHCGVAQNAQGYQQAAQTCG